MLNALDLLTYTKSFKKIESMALDFKENIELLEKIILNFIITPDDTDLFLRAKNTEVLEKRELINLIKSYYFLDDRLKDVFKVVKKYFTEHSRLPSKTEIKQLLNLSNCRFTDMEIDDVLDVDLREYGYTFLNKYTKSFVMFRNLNAALTEMMSDLKTKDITPENVDEVISKVKTDIESKLSISLADTKRGIDFFEPEAHIQIPKTGSPTGFEFLNKVLDGGWNPKTLVVFQARPKCGKSFVLANIAGRAMLRGVNVGVATLELSKEAYTKRIGTNVLNIPYKDYEKINQKSDTKLVASKLKILKANNPNVGMLRIEEFENGNATALDIENYFLKIQQQTGKKFKVIVVDYLNLMRPVQVLKDGNTYGTVKKVSEELRAVAIRNEWTIVTATQVKREAVGSNDMSMEDVAESFGLIHTVDTLFGLMRPPMEHIMKIKVIVNRDGGHTESYARFDMKYDNARLVELTGPSDVYYSDDDQTAELTAELNNSYRQHNITIEQELAGLLLSGTAQEADYDADSLTEAPAPVVQHVVDTPPWEVQPCDIAPTEAEVGAPHHEASALDDLNGEPADDDDGWGSLPSSAIVVRTNEYDDILNSL